jgi:hypothetical protein
MRHSLVSLVLMSALACRRAEPIAEPSVQAVHAAVRLAVIGVGTATVAEGAPVRLRMNRTALRRLSYAILPVAVSSTDGKAAKLVDLQYCGEFGSDAGQAVAIAVPQAFELDRMTWLENSSCASRLTDLATSARQVISAQPAWVAALRLEIRWSPWTLEIFVRDAARHDDRSAMAPDLVSRNPVTTLGTQQISTKELPKPLAAGVKFYPEGAEIALFEGPLPMVVSFPSRLAIDSLPEGTEVTAAIAFAYLNSVIQARPVTTPVRIGDGGPSGTASMVSVMPSDTSGSVVLTSRVDVEGREAARIHMPLHDQRGDLVFKRPVLSSRDEDCSVKPNFDERLACSVRNTVVRQLIPRADSVLANRLLGRAFRPIPSDRRHPIVLGRRPYNLRLETFAVRSTGTGFLFSMQGYLEDVR